MPPYLTEADVFAAATPADGVTRAPQAHARIACPETGGIKRVLLGVDSLTGAPVVVRCGRFGNRSVTCDQRCLSPAPPD